MITYIPAIVVCLTIAWLFSRPIFNTIYADPLRDEEQDLEDSSGAGGFTADYEKRLKALEAKKAQLSAAKLAELEAKRKHADIWMSLQVLVILLLLGSSLWIILSGHYNDATDKWAFGAIGVVIGQVFPSGKRH